MLKGFFFLVSLLSGRVRPSPATSITSLKIVSPYPSGIVVRGSTIPVMVVCEAAGRTSQPLKLQLQLGGVTVAAPTIESLPAGNSTFDFQLQGSMPGFYNATVVGHSSASSGTLVDSVHFEVRYPRPVQPLCREQPEEKSVDGTTETMVSVFKKLQSLLDGENLDLEQLARAECLVEHSAALGDRNPPNSVWGVVRAKVLTTWAQLRGRAQTLTTIDDALELLAMASEDLAKAPASLHPEIPHITRRIAFLRAHFLSLMYQSFPNQTTNSASLLESVISSASEAAAASHEVTGAGQQQTDATYILLVTTLKSRGCAHPGLLGRLENLAFALPDQAEIPRLLSRCYFDVDKTDPRAVIHAKRAIALATSSSPSATSLVPLYSFLFKLFRFHGLTTTAAAKPFYEQAVDLGMFVHPLQRPRGNPLIRGIPAVPFHDDRSQFPWIAELENNFDKIRSEVHQVLAADSQEFYNQDEFTEVIPLTEGGKWTKYDLFYNGFKNVDNCKRMPFTTALLERIPDAISCVHGSIKVSVVLPGTHIKPHCGPTNARLRLHLTLDAASPPNSASITVGGEKRVWEAGKAFVFDDSFEHEVKHTGKGQRIVLIVDFWPPAMTQEQRRSSISHLPLLTVYDTILGTGAATPITKEFRLMDHPRHDPDNKNYVKYLALREARASAKADSEEPNSKIQNDEFAALVTDSRGGEHDSDDGDDDLLFHIDL